MNSGIAMAPDIFFMESRSIPLVKIKTVLREFFMEAQHNPIARNFRDDGRGRDHGNPLITSNYRLMSNLPRKF